MAHEWKDVHQGVEGVFNYGKRKCINCGAEQTKESKHEWGRVKGYHWTPKVGRCKPNKSQ